MGGVIGGMHRSKLGTMVAIVAAVVGFSALAGSAQAQISGSIGGDIVDPGSAHAGGNVFQSGHGTANWLLAGTKIP
jgi:hypothetical protein